MKLGPALEEYLAYLAVERGSSQNTIESYGRDLRRYLRFLEGRGIVGTDQVKTRDVEDHLQSLAREGLSASSGQRAAAAIKGFHRFMAAEGLAGADPCTGLALPKKPEHLPDVLSHDEVTRLLDEPFREELRPRPRKRKSGEVDRRPEAAFYRDKAILEVLYGCGLRVSELAGLNLRDVFIEDELLRVMGKGSKERVVPLLGSARRSLDAYLDGWRDVLVSRQRPSDAVFLGERGTRLSRQALYQLVGRYGRLVGIEGLHPHTLRHTYATHLLEGGMDLRYVQELLGHASVSTTQIYTHVDLTHIRMEYLLAHPRAHAQG